MNQRILKEVKDEISARFKGMMDDIKPLYKRMNEMEDFKEKTVAHQVTLKKQVQAIQGEMENLRKALNETCDSLQAMNEKIAEMNPVHAGALKNEPVNMKEHDVPNQKMIATDEAVQNRIKKIPNCLISRSWKKGCGPLNRNQCLKWELKWIWESTCPTSFSYGSVNATISLCLASMESAKMVVMIKSLWGSSLMILASKSILKRHPSFVWEENALMDGDL